MRACHTPLALLVHQANRVETMNAEQQGSSDGGNSPLDAIMCEIDKIAVAIARTKAALVALREVDQQSPAAVAP